MKNKILFWLFVCACLGNKLYSINNNLVFSVTVAMILAFAVIAAVIEKAKKSDE